MRDGCVNRLKIFWHCAFLKLKSRVRFALNSCLSIRVFMAAREMGGHRIRVFSIYHSCILFLFLANKCKSMRRSSTAFVSSRPALSNQRTVGALETTPKVFDAITAIPVAKQLQAQTFSRARSSLTRHMHLNRHDTCTIWCFLRSNKLSSNPLKTLLELIHMIALLHCGTFVLLDIKRGLSAFLFCTHIELFMYGLAYGTAVCENDTWSWIIILVGLKSKNL